MPRTTARKFINFGRSALGLLAAIGVLAGLAQPAHASEAVSIYGDWSGAEAQVFQQELNAQFPASSGLIVKYNTLPNFESSINTVFSSSSKPNIALWSEPENMLSHSDAILPIDQVLSKEQLAVSTKALAYGWDKTATMNGKLYGLPIAATPRDLVFYNPRALKINKYKVPRNDGELQSLYGEINKTGSAWPWCFGLEAGVATGFPAMEWMKAYVLKFAGPAKYTAWLRGSMRWGNALVNNAGNRVSQTLIAPGMVMGGGMGASGRNFGALTAAGLYAGNKAAGQCLFMLGGLHSIATFPAQIQSEVAAGNSNEVGVFQLPTPVGGNPSTLVSGEIATAQVKTPGTAKVLAYLTSAAFGSKFLARQGWIFNPHYDVPVKSYPGLLRQTMAAILYSSHSVGYDEALLSPTRVNSVIWKNLTDWFAARTTQTKAFAAVDASYHG